MAKIIVPEQFMLRRFAFFSQDAHDRWGGSATIECRDKSGGSLVKANYLGQSIGGYPGHVENNKIIRPPKHETHVCVGELGPGKQRLVRRPGLSRLRSSRGSGSPRPR